MAKVKDYIDLHPLEWISTEELARMHQVNRKDLQKCFKQKFGKRVSEYQLLNRMEAASVMLANGEMTKKK
ncbi:AraC family transcriptional regulator [Paraflavitalea speifideaquila]|uniref:helix-turn-helix domain-containing protein n=1 Tax=Paraflavitalea speifideaquila TaxID=3076558 RepID=UPI0028E512C0|nr:AraC family transcriptional regulator [Paraflavitalea speifideiaquila]